MTYNDYNISQMVSLSTFVHLVHFPCSISVIQLYSNTINCQEFEANPNYGNHPRGGGKQGDGLFFTNLNYAKIRDNYMKIYNKQNKHNCI